MSFSLHSSILVFDTNKRFLLYKLLSKSLEKHLRKEIIQNFGKAYIQEKHLQYSSLGSDSVYSESVVEPNGGVPDTGNAAEGDGDALNESTDQKTKDLEIPDDVIYEYFAPLVNSYAISNEIDYSFEYALFDQNRHIIRFQSYKNCLILCVYNLHAFQNLIKSVTLASELTNTLYSEFYTAWSCKAMTTLIKYKFGICSDDRCFQKCGIHLEMSKLYLKWSQYNSNDLVYYLEVNEGLEVNEDIKKKCDTFLSELIDAVHKKDKMMQEFDHLDETYDSHMDPGDSLQDGGQPDEADELNADADDYVDEEELADEDGGTSEANFAFDESLNLKRRRRSVNAAGRYYGLESFLKDSHLINQYVMSYGCKLLYKYRPLRSSSGGPLSSGSSILTNSNGNLKSMSNKTNDENSAQNLFIDSNSLFLLLLEAASFLDYECQSPFIEDDPDAFKSASSTPEPSSVINEAMSPVLKVPTFKIEDGEQKIVHDSSPEDFRDVDDQIEIEQPSRSIDIRPKPSNESLAHRSVASRRITGSAVQSVSSFYEDTFQSVKSASSPLFYSNTPANFQAINRIRSSTGMNSSASPANIYNSKDSSPLFNPNQIMAQELSLDELSKNVIKFKLTSCFFQNSNKTLAFYDVLYLKLSNNLCLSMLKLNKLSKYCEIMADFEAQLVEFADLIKRKSLQLSQSETNSSLSKSADERPLSSIPPEPPSNKSKLNHSQSLSAMPEAKATLKSRPNTAKEQEERFGKQFFSVFFDKVQAFMQKLENLRRELKSEKDLKSKKNSEMKNGDIGSMKSDNVNWDNKSARQRAPLTRSYRINSRSSISHADSTASLKSRSGGPVLSLRSIKDREEATKTNSIKHVNTLIVKLDFLKTNKNFNLFGSYINNGSVTITTAASSGGDGQEAKTRTLTTDELLSSFQNLEGQLGYIRDNLNELFYELFVSQSATQIDELICDVPTVNTSTETKKRSSTTSTLTGVVIGDSITSKPAPPQTKKKFTLRFKSSATMEKKNSLTSFISSLASNSTVSPRSTSIESRASFFIDSLRSLYEKHINDYVVFMDVKLRRNIAMSFYWHRFNGLIHFSFINRQDNSCIIPTTDAALEYNQTEYRINLAYRKYMPIVWTLLYRYDCTHLQLVDDKLQLVFSYFIWFEDKNANHIPADMSHYELSNKDMSSQGSRNSFVNSKAYFSHLKQLYLPGMADKSYYDFLKAACYPNAPPDSLICYELICLHSSRIDEETIKNQTNVLISTLSKMKS